MTNALNAAALLALVALGLGLARVSSDAPEVTMSATSAAARPTTLRDHAGVAVPLREYRRIASVSALADPILLELAEPGRVISVTRHTLRSAPRPWRYAGKTPIADLSELESILALHADLVIASEFANQRRAARLREQGLVVFDLGPMQGRETLERNIREIATLLGRPDEGEVLVARFGRRLDAVAADVPAAERRRGLYVALQGRTLYGGTAGTSYETILGAGGVIDVAAAAGFRDWPAYSLEELLTLDPPWIVTIAGREAALCQHPGLAQLVACRSDRVVGVPDALLADTGLGMLEAAEAVHAAVYRDESAGRGSP